jgi:hypothetical protein
MRIPVSTISLLFFSITITAQPVVESDSYINANTVLFLESPNPLWLAEQSLTGQSGEDQEWDATDWLAFQESTQSYFPMDEVPTAYQFFFNSDFLYPEHVSTHGLLANIDTDQNPLPIQVDDPFAFYRTDETGYYNTGTAFTIEGIPIITQNDSIERLLKFPLIYGETDTSGIAYLTQVPLFGAFGQTGTRTSEVDGWGVLQTPYGEYDVLRVRSERSLTDTLYIEQSGTGETIERPLEIQYSWISPDVPGPVLSITVVEGIAINASLYAEDGVLNTNGISRLGEPVFYPNPANEYLYVNTEMQIESLSIYDMSGREVLRKSIAGEPRIPLQTIPSGAYIVLVQDKTGKIVREKLIIE